MRFDRGDRGERTLERRKSRIDAGGIVVGAEIRRARCLQNPLVGNSFVENSVPGTHNQWAAFDWTPGKANARPNILIGIPVNQCLGYNRQTERVRRIHWQHESRTGLSVLHWVHVLSWI